MCNTQGAGPGPGSSNRRSRGQNQQYWRLRSLQRGQFSFLDFFDDSNYAKMQMPSNIWNIFSVAPTARSQRREEPDCEGMSIWIFLSVSLPSLYLP